MTDQPAAATPYRVLARKYRPATFADMIGQECAGAQPDQCHRQRPHRPGLYADRRARGGQDDDGPHPCPRLQLHRARRQGRRHRHPLRPMLPLPRHRRGPAYRRHRDGCGQPHRRRRYPRADRGRALRAGGGALQDLHHRRSAYALDPGLQRLAEDAGRAAGPCEVHLRHHRYPQGAGDRALALPALRSAPGGCRGAGRLLRPDRRGRGRAGGAGGACPDRARRRRLGARRALAARSRLGAGRGG